MVWTLIEPGVAIVAASLVTIRPLLHQLKIRGFGSTDPSYAKSRSGPNNPRSRITDHSGAGNSRNRNVPGSRPGDLTLIDLETGDNDDDSDKNLPIMGSGSGSGIKISSTVAIHSTRASGIPPAMEDRNLDGLPSDSYGAKISSDRDGRLRAERSLPAEPTSWLNTNGEGHSRIRSNERDSPWPLSAGRSGRSETSEDLSENDIASLHHSEHRFA
jgi:hypothetical protein